MSKRAVIYARVSTDNQENNTSLDHQIELLTNFADSNGYVVVDVLHEVASGANPYRDGLNELRELAQNNQIDVVLCLRVDRFMRDVLEGLSVINELKKYNVQVEFIELPSTGEELTDKLIRMLFLWKGESERSIIQKRMSDGKFRRLNEGRVMPPPTTAYGYKYWSNRDNKGSITDAGLEIISEEAEIVRLIYQWYCFGDEGYGPFSIVAIAKKLSGLGIPTRKHNRKKVDSTMWARSTIRNILSNEIYKGTWYYNRRVMINGKQVFRPKEDWVAVDVPAVVSVDLWETAKRRRKQNKTTAKRNRKRDYLLSGLLICNCGLRWYGRYRTRRNGEETLYYKCNGYWYENGNNYNERRCSYPSIRAEIIEPAVWQYIWDFLLNPNEVQNEINRRNESRVDEIYQWKDRLEAFEKIIFDCDSQLTKLLEAAITEEFPKAIIRQKRNEIELQKEKAIQKAEYYRVLLDKSEISNQQIVEASQFINQLKIRSNCLTVQRKREILEILEIQIKVLERLETGEDLLEITGIIPTESIVTTSSRL